ncbi:MAG TPA: tRNA (adenosine(37)-N6)-threonylcarbamoyltransferase complex transferase subunit TsaD [Clostridiaceae bacterium]|nr:tRNA (adenosine(37)-N6)-threonylcarbamoyltransferase complex transferase subunit TsaD [Clostridiaceae bacterium]
MKDNNKNLILGIETSCDETAAAVVANGMMILSNVIASQINLHAEYGGVVPEIASREHVKSILPVIDRALSDADISLDDLTAIAVTYGPGLVGALLVGVSAAKGLAAATGLPLIPVNHLEGHIASSYLADPSLEPPFLCLIVSGGHSSLVEVLDYTCYRTLARTRDDAPGEAFDKIARSIGLGYPGGPLIERASEGGNSDAFYLPVTHFSDSYDFSFSGVKTAAINAYRKIEREAAQEGRDWPLSCSQADFAATFQASIVEALVKHTEAALIDTGYKTLVLGGGVSANKKLREVMREMTDSIGVRLIVPLPVYCTDNAAMIASAGYFAWKDGRRAALDLNAVPMAELEEIIGQSTREGETR